jgi:hypothetical protein
MGDSRTEKWAALSAYGHLYLFRFRLVQRLAVPFRLCGHHQPGATWVCFSPPVVFVDRRHKTLIKSLPQRVSAEGESVSTIRLAVVECPRLPSELIRDFGNEEAVQTEGCQPLFKSGSHEGSSR